MIHSSVIFFTFITDTDIYWCPENKSKDFLTLFSAKS